MNAHQRRVARRKAKREHWNMVKQTAVFVGEKIKEAEAK